MQRRSFVIRFASSTAIRFNSNVKIIALSASMRQKQAKKHVAVRNPNEASARCCGYTEFAILVP